MKSEGRGKKPEQDLRCIPFIAVLKRGEVCPMPYAQFPMPYLADALFGRCPIWPMPDALCQIVPDVTEKGYIFALSVVVKCTARRTLLITSGLTKLAHG